MKHTKKTLLLLLFFITAFNVKTILAQESNFTSRVILDNDSIPVFEKNYPSNAFTSSFFFCTSNFSLIISKEQFDNYKKGITGFNSDIKTFFSIDQKSIITIFPKHTSRGIVDFNEFIGNYLSKNGIVTTNSQFVKHIQVVNQYDSLDKKRGFN